MHARIKSKQAWVALKIDMEKAYDRLEWDFIIQCFRELGFHPKWVSWIKECISTFSYSILVNGVPYGLIKPSRGVRQGDPLSLYILYYLLGIAKSEIV